MVMDDVKFMKRGGLYLLVLHPITGAVMHNSRHRTFERFGDRELLRIVKSVQPGRIVVVAAMVRSRLLFFLASDETKYRHYFLPVIS